jgi:hypothetical protein
MPIRLTDRPRGARIVFDVLFNAAMLVSALILTFIVLVREEQYAFGRSPTQVVQQDPVRKPGLSAVELSLHTLAIPL